MSARLASEGEMEREVFARGGVVEARLSSRQRGRLRRTLAVALSTSEHGELQLAHAPEAARELREVLGNATLPPSWNESAVHAALSSLVKEESCALGEILQDPRPSKFGLVQCLAAALLDAGHGSGFSLRRSAGEELRVLARAGTAFVFGLDAPRPCTVVLRL